MLEFCLFNFYYLSYIGKNLISSFYTISCLLTNFLKPKLVKIFLLIAYNRTFVKDDFLSVNDLCTEICNEKFAQYF